MQIRNMQVGNAGYILPWAVQKVGDKLLINTKYDVEPAPAGTCTAHLTLTEQGYVVKNWAQQAETRVGAISITTRKYPWTGAEDNDVAPVIVED